MTKKRSRARLLLVDDEADFRTAASRALVRQGFAVVEAESGERALDMIRSDRPDLVVLDLRMGGMDGISTLQEIRKFEPLLPVIILTGHGAFSDAVAGIHFQVVDFVQKPVDLKKLGQRISGLLDSGQAPALSEKSIAQLLIPVDRFPRVYLDQSVREVVHAFRRHSAACDDDGSVRLRERTLLVFERDETFVGLIRMRDLVWKMVPQFLQDSPYSSYFTGMFLAQTKVVGQRPIGSLVRKRAMIDINAPLMEAVHAMAADHVGVLPIINDGKLVGILQDEAIFEEIAASIV